MKLYSMTERDKKVLGDVEKKALNVLYDLDINVEKVPLAIHNSVRTLGCFHTESKRDKGNISFSKQYLNKCVEENDYEQLTNTMIHEYLHAYCHHKGYDCGHNGQWKALAYRVSRETPYEITRLTKYNLKDKEQSKYIIKCAKCGLEMNYQRRTKAITYLQHCEENHRFYCPHCKSFDLNVIF